MISKERVWAIIEVAAPGDKVSRGVDSFLLVLIFANVIAVIIGSVSSIEAKIGSFLYGFEVISVGIFSIEYLTRIWASQADPLYSTVFLGRLRFALKPMPIIDLLAILPFFLPFLGVDLRSLRILRMLRFLRLAKIGRYYSSLSLIKKVIVAKKEELVLTFAVMAMLLVVSSSILFYCENAGQPDKFSSIPMTMWWSVETLTTVGYGDMTPMTPWGRLFAGIIAILGIGMFALPTGILGAGFVEEIQNAKGPARKCPHCGGEVH